MTEAQLRSKVANWLVPYIGIKEGSTSHLKIIKVFNDSKLCSRYTMTKNDHWCATSVSAAFIANGLAGAPGSGKLFQCVECSCGYMVSLAIKQGIWVEKDEYVPKIGDVILYDWDDSGVGNDTGWPEHIGIVISVNGTSSFKVIEGNMNDSVGYRTLKVNGRYIRGFITPKYANFATKEPVVENTTTKPTTTTKPSTGLNKTCKFKGTVIATELNVRSWAGTVGTTILRKLKKGTEVEVCDTIQDKDGDDWYYIKESGKYGFVSADYISKIVTTAKPNNTGLNKTCKFKGVVTAKDGLKVRSWAGTENTHLRTLKKGTKVEVCDSVKANTGKTWYYIKESGKYGFVSSDYIARV